MQVNVARGILMPSDIRKHLDERKADVYTK